jgi:hypothetical protein
MSLVQTYRASPIGRKSLKRKIKKKMEMSRQILVLKSLKSLPVS